PAPSRRPRLVRLYRDQVGERDRPRRRRSAGHRSHARVRRAHRSRPRDSPAGPGLPAGHDRPRRTAGTRREARCRRRPDLLPNRRNRLGRPRPRASSQHPPRSGRGVRARRGGRRRRRADLVPLVASLSRAGAGTLPDRAGGQGSVDPHAKARRRVLRARDRGRMSVAVISALELLLLWLVSSVLRGKGVLVVAAGVAALAASLVPAVRGRRAPLYRLFFLTALAAAGTLGAEAILWL